MADQPLSALGLVMTITQQLQIYLKSITAHIFLLLHLRCIHEVKENTSVDSGHENYSDSI
jgi:hypothetical protein